MALLTMDQLNSQRQARTIPMLNAGVVIDGLIVKHEAQFLDVKRDWVELETSGVTTFYQTFAWCTSWYENVGRASNIMPCIVVGRDLMGQIAFILPLQIRQSFGVKLLEWMAQAQNNYGFGLFDSDFFQGPSHKWFAQNAAELFGLMPRFDVINLQNMPDSWNGTANPLATLNHFKAANSSYVTALHDDFNRLHQVKRSSKSISKIRRRDERIEELGKIEFKLEDIGDASQLALREAFAHKEIQLAEMGIHGVYDTPQQDFFSQLVKGGTPSQSHVRVFRLTLNGKTLSTQVGVVYKDCFWLLITSLAPDAPRPLSPGDMLLRKSIEWCCNRGFARFDFSNGEAGYKLIWADNKISLHNYFKARTLRGLPYASTLMAFHALKRRIKNSTTLLGIFNKTRRMVLGRKLS
jgi:CelD/BcsL family acetyltransferase involved in cellulose biosynthesis